jgi:hypothetical protein
MHDYSTVEGVHTAVQEIRELASHDHEAAHFHEDALCWGVMRAILRGNNNAGGLIRTALEAKGIMFFRCYCSPFWAEREIL